MGLISSEYEKVSKVDIPCVKVLVRKGVVHYTPCIGERVCRIVLCGLFPMAATGEEDVVYSENSRFVNCGFVHVYASLSDCIDWSWRYHDGGSIEFYECVIPAGVRYWESDDGSMYAAKKIKFVKKIK